jgi:hypothetical protein
MIEHCLAEQESLRRYVASLIGQDVIKLLLGLSRAHREVMALLHLQGLVGPRPRRTSAYRRER